MLTSQLLQLYLAVLKSPVLKLSWVRLCKLRTHPFFMPSCTSDACEALNSWWPPLGALSEFPLLNFQFYVRTRFFLSFLEAMTTISSSTFPHSPSCIFPAATAAPYLLPVFSPFQQQQCKGEHGHHPQWQGAGSGGRTTEAAGLDLQMCIFHFILQLGVSHSALRCPAKSVFLLQALHGE